MKSKTPYTHSNDPQPSCTRISGKDPKYYKLLVNAESIVGDEVKALTNLVDNFSEF